MTQNDMVGWHHQLNGYEFEQISENSEGQGRLVCCSSQGPKGSATIEQLNNNNDKVIQIKTFALQKLLLRK